MVAGMPTGMMGGEGGGGMGMSGPWGMGMQAVGSIMSGIGQAKDMRAANTNIANMLGGKNIYSQAAMMAPWAYGALSGGANQQRSPWEQGWWNLANNPGYMPQSLMNMPFFQLSQAANNNMDRFGSMVGRGGFGGGLANYGMPTAMLASLGMGRANIANQQALQQNQLYRSDLQQVANQLTGAQDRAAGQTQAQARLYQQPPGALTQGGGILQGIGKMLPF